MSMDSAMSPSGLGRGAAAEKGQNSYPSDRRLRRADFIGYARGPHHAECRSPIAGFVQSALGGGEFSTMPTAPPHLPPPKGGEAGAAVRQLSRRALPRPTLQGAAALKSLMFLDLSAQARDQGAASLTGVRRIVSAGAALER
jgi:hypothetical protein